MSVSFQATGTLRSVLQTFKKSFLAHLSEEDLDKKVCLAVTEGEKDSQEDAALRDKIVEVLSDA